ncbi:MAG: HD domain-containing protein [Spirochaetales bacterium]|nr:HD domain-containing protein [Spirochaetales bacterium]
MKNLSRERAEIIVRQNREREKAILSPSACFSQDGFRLYPERLKVPDDLNMRPPFFHDTDKIIHSRAYTRYIDKTQVFSRMDNDHITHRVLHVQLVAKIARTIGRSLSLNEDLIEAISLGHDLGHVPYGHAGERALNRICEEEGIGYFSHGAQSIRAVMELENQGRGLNLTLQTMDGILCHNGELFSKNYTPERGKTLEKFLDDYRSCFTVPKYQSRLVPMTLEGCVVRLSDIIAYIGRDVEDAITVGLIERPDLPSYVTEVLGDRNDQIVNSLVSDIIENSFGKEELEFSPPVFEALIKLRKYNYERIYLNEANRRDEEKLIPMFRFLFDSYMKDLEDPQSYISRWAQEKISRNYRSETREKRIIIDYLAGMTDRFFNKQYMTRALPEIRGYKF